MASTAAIYRNSGDSTSAKTRRLSAAVQTSKLLSRLNSVVIGEVLDFASLILLLLALFMVRA
jgi:hypothetical protein